MQPRPDSSVVRASTRRWEGPWFKPRSGHSFLSLVSQQIDSLSSAIVDVFNRAWLAHSEEYIVTPHSKKWWDEECQKAYNEYQGDNSPETRRAFRSVVRKTKREFFDERIKDISETHGRPWDLMSWIKERKNPPSEAIQFNGEPCHELGQLWGALHGTYNAANDRPIDASVLEPLEDLDVREWPVFSSLEL